MRDFADVYELQSFVIEDMQDIIDLAPTKIGEKSCDLFNNAFAELDEPTIEFRLVDGGCVNMNRDELFKAFRVLLSQDFKSLLDDWNDRQKRSYCESEIQRALLDGKLEPNYTNLYELTRCAERVGTLAMMIEQTKYQIIDQCGFDAFTDALKLYECMFGFERYRI